MFTMTEAQIKRALRANRRDGRWPSSLYQIAQRDGVSRSMLTTAVKNPSRYPRARRRIELLVARERAS